MSASVFAGAFFYGCSASNDEEHFEEEISDTTSESSAIIADTVLNVGTVFNQETAILLEKYFTEDIIEDLEAFLLDYSEMTTYKDFQSIYDQGKEIGIAMSNSINQAKTTYLKKYKSENTYYDPVAAMDDDWAKLEKPIKPFMISCAVECTEIEMGYDLKYLAKSAKKTSGTMDDDFVEVAQLINEQFYGFLYSSKGKWFRFTWDLGGVSLAGEGIFLDAIAVISAFEKNHDGFKKEIAEYKEWMLSDIVNDCSFEYSKEEAVEEFQSIMKLDFFTENEKDFIKSKIREMQSEDLPDHYQFNCKDGDCVFG